MASDKALLIIDVQNDFCPGGALPVPDGDTIVSVLSQYIELFKKSNLPILVSRDWHPSKTVHFEGFGGKWPEHCVQGTKGAEFHPELQLPEDAIILSKGMDPNTDAYSAFDAVDPSGTGLLVVLRNLGVGELFIGGLATDYCVRATVLDALKNGFKVNLLIDAIQGVDPNESRKAVEEMLEGGAREVEFELVAKLLVTDL